MTAVCVVITKEEGGLVCGSLFMYRISPCPWSPEKAENAWFRSSLTKYKAESSPNDAFPSLEEPGLTTHQALDARSAATVSSTRIGVFSRMG
jgi:hypothetical protein